MDCTFLIWRCVWCAGSVDGCPPCDEQRGCPSDLQSVQRAAQEFNEGEQRPERQSETSGDWADVKLWRREDTLQDQTIRSVWHWTAPQNLNTSHHDREHAGFKPAAETDVKLHCKYVSYMLTAASHYCSEYSEQQLAVVLLFVVQELLLNSGHFFFYNQHLLKFN